jgi:hypothetical protein
MPVIRSQSNRPLEFPRLCLARLCLEGPICGTPSMNPNRILLGAGWQSLKKALDGLRFCEGPGPAATAASEFDSCWVFRRDETTNSIPLACTATASVVEILREDPRSGVALGRESTDISPVGEYFPGAGVLDSNWTTQQGDQQQENRSAGRERNESFMFRELICLKDCFSPCIC